MRKNLITIGFSTAEIIAIGLTQFGCRPFTTPLESDSGNSNTQNNEQTKLNEAQKTFDSFTKDHPEYKGREASVINFRINGVDASTIVMKSTDSEKSEINSFRNTYGDLILQPYDEAIVYTMRTVDDKIEWVRLSGVWDNTETSIDGSVNTAWYYSPDAFDPTKEINYTDRVFAFNSRQSYYLFNPLVEPASKLLWAKDIFATNNPDDFIEWDGITSFKLPIDSIPGGAGKALFMPISNEQSVEEENAYISAHEKIASSDIYTLINGKLEVQNPDNTVEFINGIEDSNLDGVFDINIDGVTYQAIIDSVSQYSIVFTTADGQKITIDRNKLTVESKLPEIVMEKFKVAGINSVDDITNATYDNTGLHITIEGQGIIDVPDEELINFVNLGAEHNGKMYGEDHFLPVYDETTGLTSIYVYDKSTKKLVFSETLSPLTISTDPKNISSCKARHIYSGALAREINNHAISFPEDSINLGWDYKAGETGQAPIFLKAGSKGVMQIANICKIPTDYLGLPSETARIITVALLNPDRSIGLLNFIATSDQQSLIVDELKSTSGFNVGILRYFASTQLNSLWSGSSYSLLIRSTALGQKTNNILINTIQKNGIVGPEAETQILTPTDR